MSKWRRVEQLLSVETRKKMAQMLDLGYTVDACMERYGLTDREQVKAMTEEYRGLPVKSINHGLLQKHTGLYEFRLDTKPYEWYE